MIKIIRHALALIREDKLFSAIYVAGTAVAIASAMVIAIFLNMLLHQVAGRKWPRVRYALLHTRPRLMLPTTEVH